MDWRAGWAMVFAVALAGCKAEADVDDVPLPAVLQQPAELPFGDRQLAEITRSTTTALDMLEPRWGELGTRPYVVESGATALLRRQVQSNMPTGWQRIDVALPPDRGELIAYASGREVFGVLIAPVKGAPVVPVTVLANKDDPR